MPALYDQAGALVASGFTVLRDSRLTQRRTDVVHDLVLGGLPYVVRKDPSGLAGNLEFLCPSGEMADAIYAAHAGGPLRLDNWQRQNLATYWRAPWAVDAGQPGTPSVVTTGGPLDRGWWQFVTSGPDSGSPFFLEYSPSGTGAIPVTAGETYALSAYVRQDSADEASPSMRIAGAYYDAAGAATTSLAADTLSTVEGEFVRISREFTVPAGSAFFKPVVSFSGSESRPAGTVYYSVGVMIEDELGAYFNGSTPDTASTLYEWQGTADLSASAQYERPALDLTYLPIGGVAVPVRESRNYWRVSVPSVQEVAV